MVIIRVVIKLEEILYFKKKVNSGVHCAQPDSLMFVFDRWIAGPLQFTQLFARAQLP